MKVRSEPPKSERSRHGRKYAEGNLGPDRSFRFRGPEGKLDLKAQNLTIFLQMADGVDQGLPVAAPFYSLAAYSLWLTA